MPHKLFICLPGLLLLGACASPVQQAQEAVAESLANIGDSQIVDSQAFPGGVLCGRYQQLDKWGQSAGPRRFVYKDGAANLRPSRDDLAVYCSEDPAAVVQQRFGVALTGEQGQRIQQVIEDLQQLAAALELYYADSGNYPTTEQGLDALRERPTAVPVPAHYPESGYLGAIPLDPWQQAYHYQGPVWAGVKSPYTLWSAGADRAEGGSGDDADIRAELIPYLQHALAD
jgi:general secretion pathway protein G